MRTDSTEEFGSFLADFKVSFWGDLRLRGQGCGCWSRFNGHLAEGGVRISTGTIMDATILYAPSSTKNRAKQRDGEIHLTRKGKQLYFGMKARVGVGSKTRGSGDTRQTAVPVSGVVSDGAVAEPRHGTWGRANPSKSLTRSLKSPRATSPLPHEQVLISGSLGARDEEGRALPKPVLNYGETRLVCPPSLIESMNCRPSTC